METAEVFKKRLKETLNDAGYSYQISKARKSSNTTLSYRPHSYKIGDKQWINKSLFPDAYSKSQKSDKLRGKRFGAIEMKSLVGKNAVRLNLPDRMQIHLVIHVIHARPFISQPTNVSQVIPHKPDPVHVQEGEEFVVEILLNLRKRGKGYQWLTLMKGEPTHEATGLPTRDVY